MFWRKGEKKKGANAFRKIEGMLWGHLVRQGISVDILQHLRFVDEEAELQGRPCVRIRIFNPARIEEAGIQVEGYQSLASRPDLILFEGYITDLRQQEPIDIGPREPEGKQA